MDGADLGAMTEERVVRWPGQTVGIVFQFFQLLPTLTALENAALPMDFARRWKPGERWERARRHLDAVGLGDKGDHLPLEDMLTRRGYTSRSQIMYAGPANNKAQARSILLIVESIGLLIVAISMLGLVNAITMSIMERTREIGVLRCLGAPARDLRRIFRTETITLALIGFALAVPLGWIVAHVLRWLVLHLVNAQLPAPYPLGDLGFALIGTLLLAVLVVAVPVRRATRLRPGDAIRYH